VIGTKWRYDAEGRVQIYETFLDQRVAKLAQQILPAVLTNDVLRRHLIDEDGGLSSPRMIASFACDVAQAMFNEMERREWFIHLPSPQDAEDRLAKQIQPGLEHHG
jgi:uncharacterized membrane protein YjdF